MHRRRLGPYELLDTIGQGGMGAVWRARHVELGVVRAVKLLLPRRGPDADRSAARFAREARLLAGVRHPNVVSLHESGVAEDGAPWFAMDLVEGEPLDAVIARGALPLDRAVDLVVDACRGVDALHEAGVVHRDLKPQNVLMTPDGRAVVIDLGLAVAPDDERLTRTGALVGTPRYMAPEQLDARGVSPRTDVHALGLILYELVTGEVALGSGCTSVHQIMGAVLATDRPVPSDVRPELPVALDAVVARAVARDPAARFERAAALAAALERVRTAPGPSRRVARTRRALVGTAALALAVVGVAAALLVRRAPAAAASDAPPAAVTTAVEPAPRLDPVDERAAQRDLSALRRAPSDRRAPLAHAWLERWPAHEGADEVRAVLREARLAAPLATLEHGPARARARFVGPDARQVVTGASDGHLRLWAETGKGWEEQRRWPAGDDVLALATTPDRRRVLLSAKGGLLRSLDPWSDVRVHDVVFLPELTALTVGPDGRTVAGAPAEPVDDGYAVRLVDLTDEVLGSLVGSLRSPVWGVALTRSGLLLTAAGETFKPTNPTTPEHALVAWDQATGEERWRVGLFSTLTCVAVSPDDRLVAVGSSSGQLLLIHVDGPDAGQRELVGEGASRNFGGVVQDAAHAGDVRAVAFSPDGRWLYSISDARDRPGQGELRAWSVDEAREARPAVRCGHPTAPGGLDVSPDGQRLLVSTRDGRVEVWSAQGD